MALLTSRFQGMGRRGLLTAYFLIIGASSVVILLSQLGQGLYQAQTQPELWLMSVIALLAGLLAFQETAPPGRTAMIICPTICFTFAILLCWGLAPALVVQFLAVVLVAWRLRRPLTEIGTVMARYTFTFAAAAAVLWFGQPDPFERNGPTNIVTDAVSVVGAVGAWLVTFALLAFIEARIRGGGMWTRREASSVGNQILFKAALLLLAPVLAVTAHINIGFVPLVFVPLLAVQRMARLSSDRDRAARMDPLTKLANRVGLRAGFDYLLAPGCDGIPGRPGQVRPTLLLLDLDRFKDVNDALGHDVGDQLLVAVADRISAVQPEGATVARLGGDEFAILTSTGSRDEATRLADKVVTALADPVELDRLRIDVSASVGIACHSGGGDFADMMRHADVAMYEAKQRGDSVAVYVERSDQTHPERLSLLADFRTALESGDREQVAMHYQPQVSLATGEVEGVEALLRWRHPVHGPISPQVLLGAVERSSVMQLLTMRVIDDVVAQVADWSARGIALRASLNVSARDLYCDGLVTHLATELARHGVRPDQIQIEITESTLLADPSRAQATVARLAGLGVSVSLDDFGTGFSSLQHLRKLNIAEIKIDRAFVMGMAHNRDDAAIVRSTIEMARSMEIRTVAEGVETEYTRRLLAENGCTLAQGWLTARAMPGAEFTRWLDQYRTTVAIPTQQLPTSDPA